MCSRCGVHFQRSIFGKPNPDQAVADDGTTFEPASEKYEE